VRGKDDKNRRRRREKEGEGMTEKKCFSCGNTSNDAPLLSVEIREEGKYVCVRCMPRLIHGG
jgi:hypothetical protein